MGLDSFAHITYESGPWRRRVARAAQVLKYEVARPLASEVAWIKQRASGQAGRRTMDGRPLRDGITYCLVARNERETVAASLESLLGLADVIVCIDNGSEDGTLEQMRNFACKQAHRVEVRVLSRPGANLRELRQEAVNLVETTWFVRGDADMVFLDLLRELRPSLLLRRRPAAVLCRKLNTFGDHRHFNRLFGALSDGEYFLRSFDDHVRYVEYGGRLEHAAIPLHYEMLRPEGVAILHLDGSKPNERHFYRTCYLDWRELVNRWPTGGAPAPSLEEYRRAWTRHNFGTEDPLSLRFRMARLVAAQCAPLPADLAARVLATPGAVSGRFVVEYRAGQPWLRVDREDAELVAYEPSRQDLGWMPEPDRYYRDSVRTAVA